MITIEKNKTIEQAYCSLVFFRREFHEKYRLEDYTDKTKPMVLLGCYPKQYKLVRSHQGEMLITWLGSDSIHLLRSPNFIEYLKSNVHRIKHAVISSYIEKDLIKAGLPYKKHPITPRDFKDVHLSPNGYAVYVYGSEKNKDFYGYSQVQELKQMLPNIHFYETTKNTYTFEQLLMIYNRCFVGLRLTKHDGLPNTVVELGLAGKRCIHNGDTPNCLPYDNIYDIAELIEEERKNRAGLLFPKVREEMIEYLKLGNWLNLNNY